MFCFFLDYFERHRFSVKIAVCVAFGEVSWTTWAVVVAQLVERLLPIPEDRGSNTVIGKNLYIEHLFTVDCFEKTKIKKK